MCRRPSGRLCATVTVGVELFVRANQVRQLRKRAVNGGEIPEPEGCVERSRGVGVAVYVRRNIKIYDYTDRLLRGHRIGSECEISSFRGSRI